MSTPNFPLDIEQGADFINTFHWYAGGKSMAPIEDIQIGYPTRIKVTGHGLPSVSDTPVIISGVDGLRDINSTDLGIEEAIYVDANYFDMPISSVGETWVIGTGEITWHTPTNITGFTARMQIRAKKYSSSFIHELTTENGGITLTVADASIALSIPAATTAGFAFVGAWYDIELIGPGGDITRVVEGELTLIREVTR